jgi:hypothetical protein
MSAPPKQEAPAGVVTEAGAGISIAGETQEFAYNKKGIATSVDDCGAVQ